VSDNLFLKHTGVRVPLICGAMYPCSNPELVAAVSEAGALGIIQPLSLTYVHGYKFDEGIKKIQSLTSKPVGFNALIEASSKVYLDRMMMWVDLALENGIRFFITALGNPNKVVQKVHAAGGFVYHDVTDKKWAMKAVEAGVDGLICVNNRAGGHLGTRSAEDLYQEVQGLGLPLVAAGGVASAQEYRRLLDMGYSAVQMGTRFIATNECGAKNDYKQAIVSAQEKDIVATTRISGVPVSVISTPLLEKMGAEPNKLLRFFLKHPKYKHWARAYFSLKSVFNLKRSYKGKLGYKDFYQAGKSVQDINKVSSVAEIVSAFEGVLQNNS